MSITYQPKKKKRQRTHGFMKRTATKSGRRVLARRRKKGRHSLTVWSFLHMLPKQNRLAKDRDFKRVFKHSHTARIGFLVLRWSRNNLSSSRFGFVVSNKVSNKSTIRHRIKRWLNESTRLELREIRTGYDCVFLTSPEIKNKKYQEVQKTTEDLFKKAGLYV